MSDGPADDVRARLMAATDESLADRDEHAERVAAVVEQARRRVGRVLDRVLLDRVRAKR